MRTPAACPDCGFLAGATRTGLEGFTHHCPRCLKKTAMWGRLLTVPELEKSIEVFQERADTFQALADQRTRILETLQIYIKERE